MNCYPYHEEIENNGNINTFFDKGNFVGYILPDGTIYPCEEHNIESIASLFDVIVYNLCNYYNDKDMYLEKNCDDKLIALLMTFFDTISHEQACALNDFMKDNRINLSDILVGIIGCHLVTRLNKKILTTSASHRPFYNYLLMGFEIENISKIIYKDGKYQFYKNYYYNNDSLYDEIKRIMEESFEDEKRLFFR